MSNMVPDHGDREHADLGASSCYRWWNCPGSLNLTAKLKPPKRTSPDAEIGTAAHEVAHMCLLSHQDAIEMVDRVFNAIVVDEAMAHNVQKYLDLCRSFMGPDAECFTERKFNLKKLNPPGPMFGTSDFGALILKLSKLIIVDYKNGYIPVDAQGNPQLKYYVLGVICSLPEDTRVKDIEVYIVQPNGRGPDIKVAHYTVAEIFTWHLELLQHAKATQDPNAPLVAGAWCKFCPNAGLCQTQADARMDDAQLEFTAEVPPGTAVTVSEPHAVVTVDFTPPEVSSLTPEQIGALLLKFPLVVDFMNSVQETAKALIASDVNIPWWKLIAGLGHRKWIDTEVTVNKLTGSYGLSEDQVWEKSLVSPATVEKLLRPMLRQLGIKGERATEMLKQALGPLTTRPSTAPRLVRDTDPAPALLARGDEFTAEPMPENVKL